MDTNREYYREKKGLTPERRAALDELRTTRQLGSFRAMFQYVTSNSSSERRNAAAMRMASEMAERRMASEIAERGEREAMESMRYMAMSNMFSAHDMNMYM